jgi:hypothetical protein
MSPSPSAFDVTAVMGGQAEAHHLFVGPQDPVRGGVAPLRAQVGRTFDVAEGDG